MAHVYVLRWGQPDGGANGGYIGALDVWKQDVPMGLLVVDDHGEHLGHRVLDAFDIAAGAGMAGAGGGELVDAEALIDGPGTFRAEL